MSYYAIRDKIYTPMREEGVFTWDWLYGQEYALASMYSLSMDSKKELQYAAEQLGKIFAKTVAMLQCMDEPIFHELGVPDSVINAAKAPILSQTATLIGRFDFARTKKGWKMLEYNSDTPGGIVEAFYANGKVCSYFGVEDPNLGLEIDITQAFQSMVRHYCDLGYATRHIVFSALDWHVEDAGTTRYLLKESKLPARFIALQDLRLFRKALYGLTDGQLQPIDILYRLHPLGMLVEDTDADEFPTGKCVLQLVEEKKVGLINPPQAVIAQTKAMQALLWSLHIAKEFFTEVEHEIIEKYMLPTYFDNAFLGSSDYVIKPVYGREGGNIRLCSADGAVMEEERAGVFGQQMVVYQQMTDLETVEADTLNGSYRGRLLWGAFLVNGKASAIGARLGGRITNDLSYFIPVYVR